MEREKFERVWQRVQGSADAAAGLRRQMEEEARSAAFYSWLSRRCRSCQREAAALQRETLRSLRTLRGEYLLLCGEHWEAPMFRQPSRGVLTELRQQYQREMEGASGSVGALRSSREKRAMLLKELILRSAQ